MLKEYKWRGYTWQIADEDLHLYPGAEEVKPKKKTPSTKSKRTPANKSRRAPNK